MALFGLESGSLADWVSGIATSGGILYTMWLNKELKRPKIELTTYLEATKEGEIANLLVDRTLIYEVHNNSGSPIRIRRTGVKFTSNTWLYQKELTSENVNLVEDGHNFQTLNHQDIYKGSFFFSWVDFFPKKYTLIRAYPYVALQDGTIIKSKKFEVYHRNAFGYDRT